MKRTTFENLSIGDEFYWGGNNWGRKRSSRTADCKPFLSGEYGSEMWFYFSKKDVVRAMSSQP